MLHSFCTLKAKNSLVYSKIFDSSKLLKLVNLNKIQQIPADLEFPLQNIMELKPTFSLALTSPALLEHCFFSGFLLGQNQHQTGTIRSPWLFSKF